MTGTELRRNANGVVRSERSRIADPTGRQHIPLGQSYFETIMRESFFVDKSLLIRDVVEGPAVTLYCRPRRFGKTVAMGMMKSFFELSVDGKGSRAPLFEGLAIWDEDAGAYRIHQGRYPTVSMTLSQAKQLSWDQTLADIHGLMAMEYSRHGYLMESPALDEGERQYCRRVASWQASDAEVRLSLKRLVDFLYRHHGSPCVILIDEYDAPVMAGDTHGYRDEAVSFLRAWLTGALKDGEASVYRTCLTGVQRVTGESLFSDLNNVRVNTTLTIGLGERFGFTEDEVRLLASYLGHAEKVDEIKLWYDGYRFGDADIYNPWSVLSYFSEGLRPAPYWVNTSSNAVLARMLECADAATWDDVMSLLEPGGTVLKRLNLNVVFKDMDVQRASRDADSLWSLLYLSGYLTTDDTGAPDDRRMVRRLRLPNHEAETVFGDEVIERFATRVGTRPLDELQRCAVSGDAAGLEAALRRVLDENLGFFDLVDENSCHNLLFGLLLGTQGYVATSERKAGIGRYDVRLDPDGSSRADSPVVTLELKFLPKDERPDDVARLDKRLAQLADEALAQIEARGYDEADLKRGRPCVRLGLGFSPTRVVVKGSLVQPS